MSPLPQNKGKIASSGLPLEVFDAAPVGVGVYRTERLVLAYTNDAYHRIFGDRPLGMPIRELFADLREQRDLDLLEHAFRTGEATQATAIPFTMGAAAADGMDDAAQRYLSFSATRIELADREPGLLLVVVEETDRVNAVERTRVLAEERRRALRRYESLIAALTQQVWVSDQHGQVFEHSASWERTTGQPRDAIRGDGWLDAAHPDDRGGLARAWFRAASEAPDLFQYTYRLRQADGSYRHCELHAVPVRENGQVLEWVGACTDIEERWLLERRGELIRRAARAVAESPTAPEAFAVLSTVLVPALADECGIYLLSEFFAPESTVEPAPLSVERVAATARPGLPSGLPPRREELIGAQHAITRAVRGRQPLHETFPPGAVPSDFAPPGTMPWLTRTGAHSGALLPILVDGEVAAVVAAFVCGDRDPISQADRNLMRELIEQAHAPLSRAMQLQRTQQVARALQHSLLTPPPEVPDIAITARYLASPAAAEVGGDWYDSFVLRDGVTVLIIGDVAGHDLEAAVTMGRTRNMLRALAVDREEPPGDILRRLDVNTLVLSPQESTTTCVLARVEGPPGGPWQLNYSVAGHPPPLLVTWDGEAYFLDDAQDILLGGLMPDEPRNSSVHPLPRGCTLLLYTDGLVERPDEDLDQGLERLRRHAATLAREPVDAFCDVLLAHPAQTGRDDIAMLALRLPAP
ncbi:SpoIIE family protein phosphatase [Streptomyces zagrosensis]|uniref:PAS domain S-box-containing protein n=1 Tax=Streptomyces zagrosensis TaxID=1042984 RepID=A0A7W9QEG1_9ACTN|nr:SpoIIE family protein phosphatase [Streptomyces zagrosensis]MBB5937722.1 PAS domain S-box-containing protein [Streptomyces zagrosensis]